MVNAPWHGRNSHSWQEKPPERLQGKLPRDSKGRQARIDVVPRQKYLLFRLLTHLACDSPASFAAWEKLMG